MNTEWIALLSLTVFTSSHGRYFAIHETFVAIWLALSLSQMITSSYLESNFSCSIGSTLVKIRRYLAGMAIMGEICMLYFYYRHNDRCEPYIYSYFCLCEYAVIFINMMYHMVNPPMLEATMNSVKEKFMRLRNPSSSSTNAE